MKHLLATFECPTCSARDDKQEPVKAWFRGRGRNWNIIIGFTCTNGHEYDLDIVTGEHGEVWLVGRG